MKKTIVGIVVTILLFGVAYKVNSDSEKEALRITEYVELLERLMTLLPNPSVSLFSNDEQYFKTISSMARVCMKLDKNGFSFNDCSKPLLIAMIKEDQALDKFQKNYIYADSKYTLKERAKIILKHDYYKAFGDVTVQYKKISDQEIQMQIKWNQNINEPYFENFKRVFINKLNLVGTTGTNRITAIEIK